MYHTLLMNKFMSKTKLYCRVFSNWFINEMMMIKISRFICIIVNIDIKCNDNIYIYYYIYMYHYHYWNVLFLSLLSSFPVSSSIFLFTRVNSYYSVPQIYTYILVTKEISMPVSFGILQSMIIKTNIHILLQIALSFSS